MAYLSFYEQTHLKEQKNLIKIKGIKIFPSLKFGFFGYFLESN